MRRNRRPPRWPFVVVLLVLVGAALVGGTVAFGTSEWRAFRSSCSLQDLHPKIHLGQNSYVYAADGAFLGVVPAKVHRQRVALRSISPWLQKATVAIEDRNFWHHDGVDYMGVVRAAIADAKAGRAVQGASTLDQQLVDNLYLPTQPHTLSFKKREACLALKIDAAWGKKKVLWKYLNTVYYGHLAYGAEAAAQTYFSRHARALGPAQAATIAGLAQAPSRYDPLRDPKAALARRNEVLQAMARQGYLTQKAAQGYEKLPLNLRPTQLYTTSRETTFFEYVRQLLVQRYGEAGVRRGGLRVFTTIQPHLQKLARRAVSSTLDHKGDPAAALVSIDRSGAIRAMVSRFRGHDMQFNLAVQGKNEAGSTFKTFVLAAAVNRGLDPFTTKYLSAPFHYPMGNGKVWTVHTYEGTYSGPITIDHALVVSDNTVFARLTVDVGPRRVARMARKMGISSHLLPVPSIGLGVNDVSVLEVARAYSTLMRQGRVRSSYAISKVLLPNGKYDSGWGPSKPHRALPRGVSRVVTKILEENVQHGTGVNAQIGRPAAGKTGTTEHFTDAWFTGFTNHLTTSVWVGYPYRNVPMRHVDGIAVQGGSFPAIIWGKYMKPATAHWKPSQFPSGRAYYRPWHGAHALSGGGNNNNNSSSSNGNSGGSSNNSNSTASSSNNTNGNSKHGNGKGAHSSRSGNSGT